MDLKTQGIYAESMKTLLIENEQTIVDPSNSVVETVWNDQEILFLLNGSLEIANLLPISPSPQGT
ncbi:MAG TPA: hypothetical protein PLD39_02705 [Flexilinea sp.]|nr:hypothetical protein [Flexilinea sp.]